MVRVFTRLMSRGSPFIEISLMPRAVIVLVQRADDVERNLADTIAPACQSPD
jgi:hypothetical protein